MNPILKFQTLRDDEIMAGASPRHCIMGTFDFSEFCGALSALRHTDITVGMSGYLEFEGVMVRECKAIHNGMMFAAGEAPRHPEWCDPVRLAERELQRRKTAAEVLSLSPLDATTNKKEPMNEGTTTTAEPPTPAPGLNIGQAIEALKGGKKARRAGWNGKGMHIHLENQGVPAPTRIQTDPYIVLFTAQGHNQPGWNASTPDLLATDWEIVG